MKKIFCVVFILMIILIIKVTVFAMYNNKQDETRSNDEMGTKEDILIIEDTMSIEEAKERFFKFVNDDERDTLCWESMTEGIPYEFMDEINILWHEVLLTNEKYLEDLRARTESRTFTNYEYYQMVLAEYLAGSPYALSSERIQWWAKEAARAPDERFIFLGCRYAEEALLKQLYGVICDDYVP